LVVRKSGGRGASSAWEFVAIGGGAFGVALSFAGVTPEKYDFCCLGGDAGVVERSAGAPCPASFAGVAGGFWLFPPSVEAKSPPKRELVDGAAGLGRSSFALPSP